MLDEKFLVSLLWSAISLSDATSHIKHEFIKRAIELMIELSGNLGIAEISPLISPDNIEKYEAVRGYYRNVFNDLSNPHINLSTGFYEKEFIEKGLLGEGGFGKVFKVTGKNDKMSYAVKKIKVKDNLKQVSNEIRIWPELKNSFIVHYNNSWFEMVTNNRSINFPHLHIQMELCESTLKIFLKQLNDELKQNEKFELTPVGLYISCQLFLEIVEAVNYLHTFEPIIIHRDLKPSNILIKRHSNGNFIKICDFGLTTNHEPHVIDNNLVSESHTTGVGTSKYMAPEVSKTNKYNEKSDLYSLGIIFKELLGIASEEFSNLDMECLFKWSRLKGYFQQFEEILENVKLLTDESPINRPCCLKILKNKKNWSIPFNMIKLEPQITEIISNNFRDYQFPKTCSVIMSKFNEELRKFDLIKVKTNNEFDAIKLLKNFKNLDIQTNIKDESTIKCIFDVILHAITISCSYDNLKSFINKRLNRWYSLVFIQNEDVIQKMMQIFASLQFDHLFVSNNHDINNKIVIIILSTLDYFTIDSVCKIEKNQDLIGIINKESDFLDKFIENLEAVKGNINPLKKWEYLISKVNEKIKIINVIGKDGKEIILITNSYDVLAIGDNKYGLLGTGQNKKCLELMPVGSLSPLKIKHIASGVKHVIAMTESGELYSWGSNDSGQLGTSRDPRSYLKAKKIFVENEKINAISCGFYHCVALSDSNKIYTWGQNAMLQCGYPSYYDYFRPKGIMTKVRDKFVSISCGSTHSLALTQSGRVYGWGSNQFGQLGIGGTKFKKCSKPRIVQISSNVIISKIMCGQNHSLLLTSDGDIYAFGNNKYGQVGSGKSNLQVTPIKVNNGVIFHDIAASVFAMRQLLYQMTAIAMYGENWEKIFYLEHQRRHNSSQCMMFLHLYL